MSVQNPDDFIPVNQVLNMKPNLGPIPGEQLIPWASIGLGSFMITSLLSLSWMYCFFMIVWGVATWWGLTGSESWRFLSKFRRVPNWTIGQCDYKSPIEPDTQTAKPQPKTKSKERRKARSKRKPLKLRR